MTFKINDGHRTVPADITVERSEDCVRLAVQYSRNGSNHVAALLDPYAARRVAEALTREADGMQDTAAPSKPTESNARLSEEMRRAKPGEVVGQFAVKSWDTSYTKRVCDDVRELSVRGMPIVRVSSAIGFALNLLKDYWDSMHKIYEDRDAAVKNLGIERASHRVTSAALQQARGDNSRLRCEATQLRDRAEHLGQRNAELVHKTAELRLNRDEAVSQARRDAPAFYNGTIELLRKRVELLRKSWVVQRDLRRRAETTLADRCKDLEDARVQMLAERERGNVYMKEIAKLKGKQADTLSFSCACGAARLSCTAAVALQNNHAHGYLLCTVKRTP